MYELFNDKNLNFPSLAFLRNAAPSIRGASKLARKLALALHEYGEMLAQANEVYRSPSLGRAARSRLKCAEKLAALHADLEQVAASDLAVTHNLLLQDFLRIEQWVQTGYAARWQRAPRPPVMSQASKRAAAALLERLNYEDLIGEVGDLEDPLRRLGDLEDSPFLKRARKLSAEEGEAANELEAALPVELLDREGFLDSLATDWEDATEALQDWRVEDFEEDESDDEEYDEEEEEP